MAQNKFIIEMIYALPHEQKLLRMEVAPNTSILDAILESDLLLLYPEIDLNQVKVGIFGKQKKLTDLISPGDRIEIYRPLLIDPKEARRHKAKKIK